MPDTRRPATTSQLKRPSSQGLSITGVLPPSRQGLSSAGALNRNAQSRSGEPVMDILAQKLILKMRARFGDAAADIKGQEIISQEVATFMNKATSTGNRLREDDLGLLESAIRIRLSGGTPRPLTMVLEKKAQVEGDEWSKIFQYSISKGKEQDKLEAQAARQRQIQMKQDLDKQMAELEAKKRAEHDEETSYFNSEQASLRAWEAQEEARRNLQTAIMRKVAQEREEQLRDKRDRIQRAMQRARDEDNATAARIAYETKEELLREEQAMYDAKKKLKSFLSSNEVNKQMRVQEKLKEQEMDLEYRRQWNAILDKQEAERTARLQANHAKQTLQAIAAANRPEAKRWMDQSIIDKAYKEREDAREKEEQDRRRRVKEGSVAMVRRLDDQMKELNMARAEMQRREEEAARMVHDRTAAMEAKEQERLRRAQEAKIKFKADLEAQMKANAHRRRVAPMSEVERKINSKLLNDVMDWRLTGRLSLA